MDFEINMARDSILRTVNQWLNDTETSYFVSDKVSVADIAVYQQIKQMVTFGSVSVEASEYERLAEWYSWFEADWNKGALKGKDQLDEIYDKLNDSASASAATPATAHE